MVLPVGLNPEGPFSPGKFWVQSVVSRIDRAKVNDYLDAEIAANRMFGPFPVPRGQFMERIGYLPNVGGAQEGRNPADYFKSISRGTQAQCEWVHHEVRYKDVLSVSSGSGSSYS